MRVQFLLPALTEATSPFFRPIKYSLFPPLGLARLAAWLSPDDEAEIQDEHVEPLRLDSRPHLVEQAVDCGLRSLFVGFETISAANLQAHSKRQNRRAGYERAIARLHSHGIMINASFVFGMDEDDPTVFDRTVAWATEQGLETATFHILTPYPDTALYSRMEAQGRILHRNWDLYDTRHCVFRPALEAVLDGLSENRVAYTGNQHEAALPAGSLRVLPDRIL